MKRMIFKIGRFIIDTFHFIFYLFQLINNDELKNHLEEECAGTVAVLANGPSLKNDLKKTENLKEFDNGYFIVMNYFAFDEIFFRIKPRHYCFADPMFFYENHRINDVRKLFNILNNKVTWSLNIYVPAKRLKQFIHFSKLNNSNIKIIPINNTTYMGYDKLRNYFYKKGLSCPNIATVANLAIYIGINSGYSKVKLYGVDHTFFDSMQINDQNQLCNKELHFYNEGKAVLKPIIRNDNSEIWKISDYLQSITNMFKSHDELSCYAKYRLVNIVNYTANSMIDSYDRVK